MPSSFCYRILPKELKNSVLLSVSLKDVQELYKVDKNLQKKILNEPLPRKISNLGIFVVDNEDPLKISLFVSLNREIDFRIYETAVHLVEELNENEIPLKISPQTFWDFLKPIISIKFFELLLHSSIENAPLYSSSLYKNFESGNFLPKASHISSLSLRTTTKYATTIFSKFDAKIVNFLKLGFNIFDELDGAIDEFLSTSLQKPNVRTCKAITWRFSMVSIEQLAFCDSKLLIIEEIWNESFQQTIEKIIAENLGKEKETMLLFYYRVYEDAIFQDWFEELSNSIRNQECEELEEEAERIDYMNEIWKNLRDELRNVETCEVFEWEMPSLKQKYFGKRISDEREAIYLLNLQKEETKGYLFQFFVKYRKPIEEKNKD